MPFCRFFESWFKVYLVRQYQSLHLNWCRHLCGEGFANPDARKILALIITHSLAFTWPSWPDDTCPTWLLWSTYNSRIIYYLQIIARRSQIRTCQGFHKTICKLVLILWLNLGNSSVALNLLTFVSGNTLQFLLTPFLVFPFNATKYKSFGSKSTNQMTFSGSTGTIT